MFAGLWPRGSFVALSLLVGACAPVDGSEDSVAQGVSSRPMCEYVKCAYPLCAPGQHMVIPNGQCCPVCRGPAREDRCAAVLCAAVACADGQILVRRGNDCCGTCAPAPSIAECAQDLDCPQIQCIACPCPVASCQGRRCVTQTPDASTCGAP